MPVDPVIQFENVSKLYRAGSGPGSLRASVSALSDRIRSPGASHGENQLVHALRDVSFSVELGETLGIIGRNGAGKTTILKLLSRITRPTHGRITLKGRVSSLIELGAGFHPDLTGRENVYLNGTILGLTRREIDKLFDRIVAFSGVEKFIDTPVKRYSSGMYVRLGFSIAVHTDPEILLVDEVLAVGDISFRKKCYEAMRQLMQAGRAVVLVSHDMLTLQGLCTRALWLDSGQLMFNGDVRDAVRHYADAVSMNWRGGGVNQLTERWGTGEVCFAKVELLDDNGRPREQFDVGEDLVVSLTYRVDTRVDAVDFWVCIVSDDGVKLGGSVISSRDLGIQLKAGNEGVVQCRLARAPLLPGAYSVIAGAMVPSSTHAYDRWGRAASFVVTADSASASRRPYDSRLHGRVLVTDSWKVRTD